MRRTMPLTSSPAGVESCLCPLPFPSPHALAYSTQTLAGCFSPLIISSSLGVVLILAATVVKYLNFHWLSKKTSSGNVASEKSTFYIKQKQFIWTKVKTSANNGRVDVSCRKGERVNTWVFKGSGNVSSISCWPPHESQPPDEGPGQPLRQWEGRSLRKNLDTLSVLIKVINHITKLWMKTCSSPTEIVRINPL